MNVTKTFFLTEVKNTGYLAAVGNFGLKPVRYLFDGKTFEVVHAKDKSQVLNRITNKRGMVVVEKKPVFTSMLKTVAAIIFLVPGLILSVMKLLSYAFADVRAWNEKVQKMLTPTNFKLRTYSNNKYSPISCQRDVETALSMIHLKNNNYRPIDALILESTDKFELTLNKRQQAVIKVLNPNKLIFKNIQLSTPFKRSELANFVSNPKWDPEVYHFKTIQSALDHNATRQNFFSYKRMHMLCIVSE